MMSLQGYDEDIKKKKCKQPSDRSLNHLEALVFPSWNPTSQASAQPEPQQRLWWELEHASCQHITGKFNYLPDWWQWGQDGTLKELKMSGSYWADGSCLPTLICGMHNVTISSKHRNRLKKIR